MEFTFQHPRTYRAEILDDASEADTILYVLHGYGQLARYFIRKFQNLSDTFRVVAPEGMHRFYTQGTYGRVGASWMTKEARETDIRDNIAWLDALDREIHTIHPIKRRLLLGFSQGGSTAIRWCMHGNTRFDALLIWASDFPPEEVENIELLGQLPRHFFIGDEDEFFPEEARKAQLSSYRSKGFTTHEYQGKHDINEAVLRNVLEEITRA